MKKHESFEENGLVWITGEDCGVFHLWDLVTEIREKNGDEFSVSFDEWQKATAKAIFKLMPNISLIVKTNGRCETLDSGGMWFEELSIDIFPFSEYGEILREDVM